VCARGILVHAIAPAVIGTELLQQMEKSTVDLLVSKIPMGRVGRPEEVAALVAWLASDDCSFTTGAVHDLSGGPGHVLGLAGPWRGAEPEPPSRNDRGQSGGMIERLWFGALARARIYRRLILRERPLSQPFPDLSVHTPVSVSLLAAGEIDAYMTFRPDQSIDEVRSRLDEGQQCFAVWQDRRIVHAAWAVTGRARIEYLSTEITPAPDEAYWHDVFTAPAFRGRGVAGVRMVEMMRCFRDRGYRRMLGAILPENRSSLRLDDKAGWARPIGLIGYVGLGPWRHVFCRIERGASPPGRAGLEP